ncbi:protein phosphatase 2C domain-containing protein [Streptomyces sp. NPDC051569]|uniref:protein phosphatase 2C domain-containing protein n=1 Tax=Streptomyces sp. NPDC051569 TaxID=3365661 RepID=UPI00379428D0
MSQMDPSAARPTCPSCAEPLESGDLFCGACGYDLSAVPPPAADHPTLVIPGAGQLDAERADTGQREPGRPATGRPATGTPAGAVPGAVNWPTAAGTGSTQSPSELDRLSGDFELPAPGTPPPGQAPAATGAVLRDASSRDPAGHGTAGRDAVQAASAGPAAADPRTADPAVVAPAGTKLCVACRAGRVDTDGYCENCGHAQPRERDHMEQQLDAVAAVSDRGLRHHRNEDAFAVSSAALPDGSPAVIAIVCDGVSSATRPDEASAAAAAAANESLLDALPRGTHPQQAMHEAIVTAAEAVNALAPEAGITEHEPHRQQNAPACTIVGAVVAGGLLVIGWVGDSRAYWVPDDRSGPPARLTEDDSWAAQMVAAGLMNEAEAYADQRAHAITGWLGADAYELEPHTASFKPDRPGVVVVCTDGLWNYAEGAEEMAGAVPADAARRPLHAAQVLVGHALDGGGHDNVTVALLPFAVPPPGAGSAHSTA